MKARILSRFVALAAVSLALSIPVFAQKQAADEEPARDSDARAQQEFSGTYQLASSRQAVRQQVDQAVDDVVDDMSFLKRGIARDKLEAKTVFCSTLRVSFPQENVAMRCDGRPVYLSPKGGQKVRYNAEDGAQYNLGQVFHEDTLRQTFVSEDGKRTNIYKLGPDGENLVMQATLQSEQLPRPLTYRIKYVKK